MTFLTRGQLDLLRERVEAGADPVGVALWISRVTDIGDLTVGVLAAAAEDLRRDRAAPAPHLKDARHLQAVEAVAQPQQAAGRHRRRSDGYPGRAGGCSHGCCCSRVHYP